MTLSRIHITIVVDNPVTGRPAIEADHLLIDIKATGVRVASDIISRQAELTAQRALGGYAPTSEREGGRA